MPKDNDRDEHEQEHQKRERGTDRTLADSFPSSDPAESAEEPAQGIAGKTDRAFRTTAQSYLDRAGLKLDLRQLESTIRDKPVQAAAIAAAAGFLFGGGMGTRWGAAILTLAGRKAARDTAGNLVSGMVQHAVR
jgi:ElaB/YqjD/DUF883 family membrane-anchored ribosome-binding protein